MVTFVRSTQFLIICVLSGCTRFTAEIMATGRFEITMACLHCTDLQKTSIRSPDRYTAKRQPNRDTPMPEMLNGMSVLILGLSIDEPILLMHVLCHIRYHPAEDHTKLLTQSPLVCTADLKTASRDVSRDILVAAKEYEELGDVVCGSPFQQSTPQLQLRHNSFYRHLGALW